jgi:hypothetical protein
MIMGFATEIRQATQMLTMGKGRLTSKCLHRLLVCPAEQSWQAHTNQLHSPTCPSIPATSPMPLAMHTSRCTDRSGATGTGTAFCHMTRRMHAAAFTCPAIDPKGPAAPLPTQQTQMKRSDRHQKQQQQQQQQQQQHTVDEGEHAWQGEELIKHDKQMHP